MTALNGTPRLEQDTGELADLSGLEAVSEQLAGLITVLRAEQARRRAGIAGHRPAWKNLVFAGGPGYGKSRMAGAVAACIRARPAGVRGADEIAAADLTGSTCRRPGPWSWRRSGGPAVTC